MHGARLQVMPPRRSPLPPSVDALIVTAPGLEPLARRELARLDIAVTGEEPGAVSAMLTTRDLMRANLHLRTASRVVVRLSHFKALTFADVEKHGKRVPWETVVVPGQRVRFRVTCRKSRLYHSGAVAQRLMEALALRVRGVVESTAADDEEEGGGEQLFVVRLFRDQLVLSVDSSGALLHRRGYRQATAKAPLRETLAAAMLAASEWDNTSPLVDPLCGSGTIPIEGALQARQIAPGAHRRFAMERWPTVAPSLGERVRAELAERARPRADAEIVGSDRDAGAIAAASSNAERAGVSEDIVVAVRSLSAAVFPDAARGWIVTNPPYGVRVGEADRVRDLWAQLGNVLRDRAPGWRLALLSPDTALERQLKIPLRAAASISNGGIPVRIMIGDVPA